MGRRLVLALALTLAGASVASACWCTDMTLARACEGRAARFFTARVESVDTSGSYARVRFRIIQTVAGPPARVLELRMGMGRDEISSCDGRAPFAVGEYVLVAQEHAGSHVGICDLTRVLPSERAARRPCDVRP